MLDQTNQSTIVSYRQTILSLKEELKRLTRQKQSAYSMYTQLRLKINNTEEQLRKYTENQLQQFLPNSHRLAHSQRQQLQNHQNPYLDRTQPQPVVMNASNCLRICPSHMQRMTLICMSCQKSICQVCAKKSCLSHKVYPQYQGLKIKSRQIKEKYTTIINDQRQNLRQVVGQVKVKMFRKQQKAKWLFNCLLENVIDKKKQIISKYEQNLKELFMVIARQKDLLNFIDQNFNGHRFQGQIFAFKNMNDLMMLQKSLDFGLDSFKKDSQYNNKSRNRLAKKELDEGNFSKIQEQISNIKLTSMKISNNSNKKQVKSIKIEKHQLKSAKSLSQSKFKSKKNVN